MIGVESVFYFSFSTGGGGFFQRIVVTQEYKFVVNYYRSRISLCALSCVSDTYPSNTRFICVS